MDFGHVDSQLTAIATGYRNRELIGDEIAPAVKTATSSFKYYVWDKKNNFTIPQTVVGKTGEFNKVQFGGRFENGAVENHGLATDIPLETIKECRLLSAVYATICFFYGYTIATFPA